MMEECSLPMGPEGWRQKADVSYFTLTMLGSPGRPVLDSPSSSAIYLEAE